MEHARGVLRLHDHLHEHGPEGRLGQLLGLKGGRLCQLLGLKDGRLCQLLGLKGGRLGQLLGLLRVEMVG